ncbi:hypothetical protein SAMN04490248_111100 [Salinihabitans flavidus]|uniref:Uncharacterized protein n=1 Tax=Salinihabitans flavidus TaxID=569882 RepID=A0A1H8SC62_9RHOB|nr:hypothetical protein SAMN04490248_111100 [Salinihabitans flavidus]
MALLLRIEHHCALIGLRQIGTRAGARPSQEAGRQA